MRFHYMLIFCLTIFIISCSKEKITSIGSIPCNALSYSHVYIKVDSNGNETSSVRNVPITIKGQDGKIQIVSFLAPKEAKYIIKLSGSQGNYSWTANGGGFYNEQQKVKPGNYLQTIDVIKWGTIGYWGESVSGTIYDISSDTEKLPGGSYGKSCDEKAYSGGLLRARCETRGKKKEKVCSNLMISKCGTNATASNIDGQLRCDNCSGDYCYPCGGSYARTCRGCYIDNNKIHCMCETRDKKLNKTSINYKSCKDYYLHNEDGNLVCGSQKAE